MSPNGSTFATLGARCHLSILSNIQTSPIPAPINVTNKHGLSNALLKSFFDISKSIYFKFSSSGKKGLTFCALITGTSPMSVRLIYSVYSNPASLVTKAISPNRLKDHDF